jgi:pectin lyase
VVLSGAISQPNGFSYNAGVLGITVNSDKTLIGSGSSGVIKGKGLRIVSGASNIIIQ